MPDASATQDRSLPITVRNLTKSYGDFKALDDIGVDVRAGEFMTLLGPSGSGKTTLLMALAGFVSPDSGSILFGEQEVVALSPHKRGLGMVFQSYALFPLMSVAENVAYPLKLRGVPRPEIGRRVQAALEMVQLGAFGERRIHQLSGGQRQRVALARAMVFEPRIILMDEPLSALDKKLREQMQIEIKSLHRKLGATIVYVTHDQREALTMSDRVAVLDRGRIAQIDTPQALYRRPRSLFVADFVGESVALPVQVEAGVARHRGVPLHSSRAVEGPALPHYLILRPELIELLDGQAPPSPPGTNELSGNVRELVFQGDSVLVLVDLGKGEEVAVRLAAGRVARGGLPQQGAAVRLAFDAESTLIVPATDP